jgi:hypothetical protein
MLNLAAKWMEDFLTLLFVVGAVGCVFVIPVTAIKLFNVLFEKDVPGER